MLLLCIRPLAALQFCHSVSIRPLAALQCCHSVSIRPLVALQCCQSVYGRCQPYIPVTQYTAAVSFTFLSFSIRPLGSLTMLSLSIRLLSALHSCHSVYGRCQPYIPVTQYIRSLAALQCCHSVYGRWQLYN